MYVDVAPPDQRQHLTRSVIESELGKPLLFPRLIIVGRFSCKGLHNTMRVKDVGESEGSFVMSEIKVQNLP
jgi:hypothetical protein